MKNIRDARRIVRKFSGVRRDDAIFERGVPSLAIKWNNCVGCVAEQADPVTVIPRRATNRHNRADSVVLEISRSVGMRGTASRNSSSKSADVVLCLRCGEAAPGLEFPEKRQVNEPSEFGSAIIMKLFRGQIWSAFFSSSQESFGPGSMVNYL